MTHQQILDKLAAKYLVKSIDEDLARLTFDAICYNDDPNKQLTYILPKLLNRWNCILNAENTIADNYKLTTVLALSILLHKYGFSDIDITNKAIKAIDKLNKNIALKEDFFRKSEEIKQFILSKPIPLKRKPTIPESITCFRAKDVISIQLEDRFYAAYIHEIRNGNSGFVLEFYDHIFNRLPTLKEVENLLAKGNDQIFHFLVFGIRYQPDLANQIVLIGANVETKPSNIHLKDSKGTIVQNIFDIQHYIKVLFKFN